MYSVASSTFLLLIVLFLIFSYHPRVVSLRASVRSAVSWPADTFTNTREAPYHAPIEASEATSYSEDIRSSIDPSIVDSHNEFVADTDFLATTGASHAADRDDFLPPVPFHGLPRKAHYMNTGSEKDARVVQSETDMDINYIREHHNTSYVL
jgi:hypothetical protein